MDRIYVKMTLEELCETYHFSKSSVQTKFNRTAESFRKKYGLDLVKVKGLDGVILNKEAIKDVPIIVKLTPNVTDITAVAKASEEAGADALTLINSVGPGLRIDYQTAKPILNNVLGGIAGPMIKPIALKCVYNTYKTVDIPIFGVGGIKDYRDVLEFMYAGSSLLQIGTSIMYSGPEIFRQISDDLTKFLQENGYTNVTEIIGLSHEI